MSDLPTRLEAAIEGSRALDLEILNAPGESVWYWLDRDHETVTCDLSRTGAPWNPVAKLEYFTTSVDAAVRLLEIPGQQLWTWTLSAGRHDRYSMYWIASVVIPSAEFRGQSSANPALAICAAALRARAG